MSKWQYPQSSLHTFLVPGCFRGRKSLFPSLQPTLPILLNAAGGTLPSLASTPQRQAKQSSGRDQDQPWVLTTRQFHSEEVGFLNFYLFSLGAAKTVEVAQCTFQRCLLLQSFQHPWIIQALRQYPSPAAGQLLVMISS